jgi:hypothetical protein
MVTIDSKDLIGRTFLMDSEEGVVHAVVVDEEKELKKVL